MSSIDPNEAPENVLGPRVQAPSRTMGSFDPNETNLDRYREALDAIVQADPKSFSEISGHGVTLNLSDCVPVVGFIVGLFRRIRDSDLNAIPDPLRTQLAHEINRTLAELQRIRRLDPRNQSPENIWSSLRGVYQEVYTNLAPILAHVGTDPAGFDELRRQAEAAVGEITSAGEQAGGMLEESRTALEQVQEAAAEAGVSQHAVIFRDIANRHRETSHTWLAVSTILALATLWVAWQMAGQVEERTVSEAIQFVTARVILFGVMTYSLVSAVRTYRAEAHNHVVNAHRHHALSTFETFTAASSDEATKNAVLMQATQCIFSHRPSGFGHREDDTAPQSQVLELTRNVLPPTSE